MIYLCHCEEPTGDVAIRIPCGAKHRRGCGLPRAYALAMTW